MDSKRQKSSPEKIGSLINSAFKDSTLGERLKDLAIWSIWDRAVGESVARRAKPLRLIGGTLTVVVTNSAWMQQLSFMKTELKDRLNSVLGESRIDEIVLRSGVVQKDEPIVDDQQVLSIAIEPTRQTFISRHVNELDDVELREMMRSLMESHYRRCIKTGG